ncbi:MAG: hypothetical protein ACHP7N_09210 [Caulobacterales bacterium]
MIRRSLNRTALALFAALALAALAAPTLADAGACKVNNFGACAHPGAKCNPPTAGKCVTPVFSVHRHRNRPSCVCQAPAGPAPRANIHAEQRGPKIACVHGRTVAGDPCH